MYRIYNTKCFIVDSRNSDQDDKSFLIFSKEFGFIDVKAKSVRKENSKMKNFLHIHNFCEVSLTKGKGGWILTGGNIIYSPYYKTDGVYTEFFVKFFSILKRLSLKEEKQQEAFSILEDSIVTIKNQDFNFQKEFEIFMIIKILEEMGYFAITSLDSNLRDIFKNKNLSEENSYLIRQYQDILVNKINDSMLHIS